jgi:hypothetical protein
LWWRYMVKCQEKLTNHINEARVNSDKWNWDILKYTNFYHIYTQSQLNLKTTILGYHNKKRDNSIFIEVIWYRKTQFDCQKMYKILLSLENIKMVKYNGLMIWICIKTYSNDWNM